MFRANRDTERQKTCPPQFLLRYTPPYPEEAPAQKLLGTVLLLVSIHADGRATDMRRHESCGHGVLD